MIWFIVLNIVLSDGTLYTELQFPNSPQYNNEKTCNEVGQTLANQRQLEIGTNAGRSYFICKSITPEQIKAATGEKQGNNL